ncbi:hypothetical protein DPMN_083570 [Dreissena polymorpha]|uniref:Uncharacterized protein n=1 Tax=Dreissena polymorpha TaxID=45954 RepID=A0A9D3YCW9_DREPO|nr:hypothetical protein DPMN_083570 [Dreissena polymorpha]
MLSITGDYPAIRLHIASSTSLNGRTFVVRFSSEIVLKETGVLLQRVVVEVTAVFTPSV